MITQIEIARAQGKPYVYLGYRVDACASLKYKAAFHPQEELVGRPLDFEDPVWTRIESTPEDANQLEEPTKDGQSV